MFDQEAVETLLPSLTREAVATAFLGLPAVLVWELEKPDQPPAKALGDDQGMPATGYFLLAPVTACLSVAPAENFGAFDALILIF
jgi:hypothetical protein